jgi:hypothetical protein
MRDSYVNHLIAKYKTRGAIIDTNLLVLVVVGNYRPDRIGSHRRTATYTTEDFALMMRLIARFERVYATPNIFTEVDNLSRALPRQEYVGIAGSMRSVMGGIAEIYFESRAVGGSRQFPAIGLADAATMLLASRDLLVITDDLPLAHRLQGEGRDVININHIRTML